eukprot:TRINITY_DN2846_c0_g1_i1.p1 TRINITY_DN2846_c0_g1~~TRINITY_DN2846_c0_g1_i1.p1  ORF type:complete len:129 (-),score=18.55 TRINITY_DN2846_c0_g1_i1:365-751(-)
MLLCITVCACYLRFFFFFLMIRRPPRSTLSSSSAASDVYKRQIFMFVGPGCVDCWDEYQLSSVRDFLRTSRAALHNKPEESNPALQQEHFIPRHIEHPVLGWALQKHVHLLLCLPVHWVLQPGLVLMS